MTQSKVNDLTPVTEEPLCRKRWQGGLDSLDICDLFVSPLALVPSAVNRPARASSTLGNPSFPFPIISVTNGAIKGGILIIVVALQERGSEWTDG